MEQGIVLGFGPSRFQVLHIAHEVHLVGPQGLILKVIGHTVLEALTLATITRVLKKLSIAIHIGIGPVHARLGTCIHT